MNATLVLLLVLRAVLLADLDRQLARVEAPYAFGGLIRPPPSDIFLMPVFPPLPGPYIPPIAHPVTTVPLELLELP